MKRVLSQRMVVLYGGVLLLAACTKTESVGTPGNVDARIRPVGEVTMEAAPSSATEQPTNASVSQVSTVHP